MNNEKVEMSIEKYEEMMEIKRIVDDFRKKHESEESLYTKDGPVIYTPNPISLEDSNAFVKKLIGEEIELPSKTQWIAHGESEYVKRAMREVDVLNIQNRNLTERVESLAKKEKDKKMPTDLKMWLIMMLPAIISLLLGIVIGISV